MIHIGQGYDVHPLVEGRALILGGVRIPHAKGLQGHSDADALLHAICDASLGAAGLGDLGGHFSERDPKYKDIDSRILVRSTRGLIAAKGWRVVNVDCTILIQAPRVASYLAAMGDNIAADLEVSRDRVNVKATSPEGLGFAGREEGIAAYVVVLLERSG